MTATTQRPVGGAQTTDRALPHDDAAEQSVLGGMLMSTDVIDDVVEILTAADFYQPRHGTIFTVITELAASGQRPDSVTVAAALTQRGLIARVGGAAYLHDLLAAVPTTENVTYYARIVADRAVLRTIAETGTKIAQLGFGTTPDDTDGHDRLDRAQQMMLDLSTARERGDGFEALVGLLQPALDEIEGASDPRNRGRGIPTGFSDLDRLLGGGLNPGQLVVVAGRPAMGKALALDTVLPTPDGWTTMGEVEPGARLLGADGRPTTIVNVFDVLHGRPCFEVTFSDGSKIVADAEHLWRTNTRAARRARETVEQVVTTEQIAKTLRAGEGRANHAVRLAAALDLPVRDDLPIPPYTLGVWLGDGHSAAARFTTVDQEIIANVEGDGFVVRRSGPMVYSIRPPALPPSAARTCIVCGEPFQSRSSATRTCGRACGNRSQGLVAADSRVGCTTCGKVYNNASQVRRCAACHSRYSSFVGYLRAAGVLGNKHIPGAYLRAEEQQRRSLLAGLMDTDGTVTNKGVLQYCSTSRQLAEGVRELVVSLGYRCSIAAKPVRGHTAASSTAYLVNFTTPDQVFRLERKQLVHKERARPDDGRRLMRFIAAVTPVPSVPVRCIQVDNADHMYLAGQTMIPTHNSTLALDAVRHAAIRGGHTAAIFSLEMSKVEIVLRLLSAEARVPLHNLRTGELTDDDWSKLARRMGEIAEAPLFVDDSPTLNLMEIRAKARRLKQRHDLKLIVVDYLSLMTSATREESRQQEVANMSRGLKLLAKEVECPVIAVHQLNRGPEQRQDKRPQLSDLRESGAVEQDADIVILIHREDYYDRESQRSGEADFIVAKHRNGATDTVTVAAQLHLSRFVDMAIA